MWHSVALCGVVWWGDRLTQVGDLVPSKCLFSEVSNFTAVCPHVPLSEKESHSGLQLHHLDVILTSSALFALYVVHGVWSCVSHHHDLTIYCAYMCVGPYPNHLLLFLPHDPFLASPLMHARIIQCPSLSAVSLVCTGT